MTEETPYSAKHYAAKAKEYAEQAHADQLQADWTQSDTTKVDFIKNKPTIPAAQVNSDWSASGNVAEVLNKPTKLSDFTDDTATTPVDRATGDGSGNEITATYANKDLDNLSVSGNDKLAVSTVFDLLGSGQKYLYNNKTYKIQSTGNLVFRPSGLLSGKTNTIMVYLKKTDAAHTVDLGTTYYFNCEAPDLSEAGDYNVIYEYDPNNSHWVVGAVKKGAAS